jgi:hypothetical protein
LELKRCINQKSHKQFKQTLDEAIQICESEKFDCDPKTLIEETAGRHDYKG